MFTDSSSLSIFSISSVSTNITETFPILALYLFSFISPSTDNKNLRLCIFISIISISIILRYENIIIYTRTHAAILHKSPALILLSELWNDRTPAYSLCKTLESYPVPSIILRHKVLRGNRKVSSAVPIVSSILTVLPTPFPWFIFLPNIPCAQNSSSFSLSPPPPSPLSFARDFDQRRVTKRALVNERNQLNKNRTFASLTRIPEAVYYLGPDVIALTNVYPAKERKRERELGASKKMHESSHSVSAAAAFCLMDLRFEPLTFLSLSVFFQHPVSSLSISLSLSMWNVCLWQKKRERGKIT